MVWDQSLKSLHSFIDDLNSFQPTIKLTNTISTVTKSDNLDFITEVYVC